MSLQHLARLFAFRQQPYILFIVLGLYIGMIGYAVTFLCMKCEERRQAVVMEISQASPQISDQFVDVVFNSNYTKHDIWMEKLHSMMTRKAQAKFDQIFLSSGAGLYQNGNVTLVPWEVTTAPNVSINRIMQVVHTEQRGARVSRRVVLIDATKNNMPIKEFTFDLKIRKKHGKILIADINVSNSLDGTTYEKFLHDSTVIENLDQYTNNRSAAFFYGATRKGASVLSPRIGNINMALSLNPRFTLARLERVKYYIFNNQLDLAEKDLLEAHKYGSGPEYERLMFDYAQSIQYVKNCQQLSHK